MIASRTQDSRGMRYSSLGGPHHVELPVPLNSRHLTDAYLKRLLVTLEISAPAASVEVKQMTEGKLIEMERD